jgi:hypothetical protein
LESQHIYKSAGLDDIPSICGMKETGSMLTASFTVIFEKLWESRELQEMKRKENTMLYLHL